MNTNSGELHIVDFKSTSNQSKDPKPGICMVTGRCHINVRWICISGY